MAKASKIIKAEQRRKLVERCAEHRAALKEIIRNRGELPGVRKSSW
jgi:small subunit ribosomal protein S14